MNRGIYATATGMLAVQRAMDTVANNLANVSTTAFKKDGVAFQEAFLREMRADGGLGPVLGTMGSGAQAVGDYTDAAQGPINRTGNPLNLAIQSEKGMFAVQTPSGVRYTRDGSFQLDAQNQLVNANGYAVLDSNGNSIQVPNGQGEVVFDGKGNLAAGAQQVAQVGIFEGTFTKAGDNLYTGEATPATDINVVPGALEGSNVNAVESMIEMITMSRQFEMAQRSITQQDELTQKLIQSLNDR